jgi:hypothetical protein
MNTGEPSDDDDTEYEADEKQDDGCDTIQHG